MFENENHISEAIEIAISSDLEDHFLAYAISAQVGLMAGIPIDECSYLGQEPPLH